MFALSEADLQLRVLGCADGPASFNAEATRQGTRAISCDPLYRLSAKEIRDRSRACSQLRATTMPKADHQGRRFVCAALNQRMLNGNSLATKNDQPPEVEP